MSRLLARARVDEHLVTVSLRPFADEFTLAFDPQLHIVESSDILLNDIACAQAHDLAETHIDHVDHRSDIDLDAEQGLARAFEQS